MTSWSYHTMRINTTGGHLNEESLDARLNALGEENWELVEVTPVLANQETMFLLYTFRRPGETKNRAGFRA
jgi:hypothetical protein